MIYKKLSLIMLLIVTFIGTAFAGSVTDISGTGFSYTSSSSVFTFNGGKVCSEGIETSYDFSGSNFSGIGRLNMSGNQIIINDNRILFSIEEKNITVCSSGCDYNKIQKALDSLPYYLIHPYRINISDGDYSDEDLILRNINGNFIYNNEESTYLRIDGNGGNASKVKIGSFIADNIKGIAFKLYGVETQHDNPYTNENAGIEFYSVDEGIIQNVRFANGTNGFVCYSSRCQADSVDFGENTLTGMGIILKHMSLMDEQKNTDIPTYGNVGGYAYNIQSGIIHFQGASSTLTGDLGLIYDNGYNGIAYDSENEIDYFTKKFNNIDGITINSSNNDVVLNLYSTDLNSEINLHDSLGTSEIKNNGGRLELNSFIGINNDSIGIGDLSPINSKIHIVSDSEFTGLRDDNIAIKIGNSGSLSGLNNLGGALGFTSPENQDQTHALIISKQTGSDGNQVGLSFWTNDGTSSNNLKEKITISHTGQLIIGNSSSSQNITMYSPDGTAYTCGVANGGAFSCS